MDAAHGYILSSLTLTETQRRKGLEIKGKAAHFWMTNLLLQYFFSWILYFSIKKSVFQGSSTLWIKAERKEKNSCLGCNSPPPKKKKDKKRTLSPKALTWTLLCRETFMLLKFPIQAFLQHAASREEYRWLFASAYGCDETLWFLGREAAEETSFMFGEGV